VEKVPRDHRESDEAFAHRRRMVAGVSVAGAGLLGVSLSSEPDSPRFYVLTLGVAGTWLVVGDDDVVETCDVEPDAHASAGYRKARSRPSPRFRFHHR